MKARQTIMGMPVIVEIVDAATPRAALATTGALEKVFAHFRAVDAKFSTYKPDSEITLFNQGKIAAADLSAEMQEVFALAEQTKQQTSGYFDIWHNGSCDPSGLVKGWAINKAAELLRNLGFQNFYVEAGGDIQVAGKNSSGEDWRIGIRNPFRLEEIIKVVTLRGQGIATSGSYERGAHIYNPKNGADNLSDIVGLTVIGPNIYEADRFATAAFAMGRAGLAFIAQQPGLAGYMVDKDGLATQTPAFEQYVMQLA